MEYKRADRVADLLRREMADLLLRRIKDPRVSKVTITAIEVTDDLQNAKVFYCLLGAATEEEKRSAALGLNRGKGFMRLELGKRLHLKYLPQLSFHYDSSFEYGDKIERLLKELHKNE